MKYQAAIYEFARDQNPGTSDSGSWNGSEIEGNPKTENGFDCDEVLTIEINSDSEDENVVSHILI